MCWVLSGCQTAPDRDAQALDFRVGTHWSATPAEHNSVATSWLKTFNDPQLTILVQDGLSENFDLRSAAARVAAAREQAVIAGSGRLPQLYFLPGYQRSKNDGGSGAMESGAFTALFNFNWELDVWGRIKAGQQAATEEAMATADDYRAAQLSLAARIAQVYYEWLEAQLQAQVADQSVRDRSVIAGLIRGRFNKGLTRGLDLRLVLTDLANAEAQLAQARNDVQRLGRQLQTLLARYPDNGLVMDRPLPKPPEALTAGLPAELLTRRPDVLAAFKRLRAADSRLESAEKALLPRITLTAAGGSGSAALTELIDPRAVAWNVAAGLTQPLFTGGRLQGEIRLNQARVQDALNQYQSVALNAFREVEQALAAESLLRDQEKALREAVDQTEASRKLAVYSYQQGLIQILTLLDSYRSTLNAQSAHLRVQRQLLNNRITLYLALGGAV
ncbi:efflux transporter outer membrane subunit [Methylomonas methanica]|uniref:RND efflux system, outer membrane lipoprotein, NodT family n=1 Tax=Methylomonas methanica (strain DSM 25384 / MC09) TaxID=857087 RepID=F9ZWN1_METMM|nr:efflux transporter outer membrane subunit [Methylomonas methanica]AEG00878.1 RND efflux system, outer membrane lipoprotein, NodT family [Methylomonas methanica MC09]